MTTPPRSQIAPSRAHSPRSYLALFAVATISIPTLLSGCHRAAADTAVQVASPQSVASAREQMDLIPPPSKTRYMAVRSLETWQNPYLTVQENIATLHVTMADANPSQVGAGGLLRPVAARSQNVTVRVTDLPAALGAIPENSWPYGRVVAIEEAHNAPPSARPAIRRNVEATIKTLSDLGVVVYEWSDSGPGLR